MRRCHVVGSREAGDGIVGGSRAIRTLRELIGRVAPTEATVLIVGERGTGKELVARALHAGSGRASGAFVAVNCAALPAELLAAELFGHERGAFTGALQARAGLLAAAQGGTLFLDEIGDLSLQGQAMLLRFLQEGEARPLGSDQVVRLDVRVLAATNRDLERAMGKGRFRADLYDRLSDFVLLVPPLRERRADLPLLIEHFLRLHARRHGLPVPAVSAGARRLLAARRWPGNVRELEKTLRRGVILAGPGLIETRHLRLPAGNQGRAKRVPGVVHGNPAEDFTARELEILRIATEGPVRCGEVMARFSISGETARRALVGLVQRGFLERTGHRRGARYHVSRLPLALRQGRPNLGPW